jgi:hypothetical protein
MLWEQSDTTVTAVVRERSRGDWQLMYTIRYTIRALAENESYSHNSDDGFSCSAGPFIITEVRKGIFTLEITCLRPVASTVDDKKHLNSRNAVLILEILPNVESFGNENELLFAGPCWSSSTSWMVLIPEGTRR